MACLTLRLPLRTQVIFGSLVIAFFLLAGGNYSEACRKAGGYVGFFCGASAIYAAFATLYKASARLWRSPYCFSCLVHQARAFHKPLLLVLCMRPCLHDPAGPACRRSWVGSCLASGRHATSDREDDEKDLHGLRRGAPNKETTEGTQVLCGHACIAYEWHDEQEVACMCAKNNRRLDQSHKLLVVRGMQSNKERWLLLLPASWLQSMSAVMEVVRQGIAVGYAAVPVLQAVATGVALTGCGF